MEFTVVFPSSHKGALSVSAVFIPCLVWMEGKKELLNPHPRNPHYAAGDLLDLFQKLPLRGRIAGHTREVVVVVHNTGHGTQEYLDLLLADLNNDGFEPKIIGLG